MNLADERILVTGGSGFLGAVIVRLLREQSEHVMGLSSSDGDLSDPAQTAKIFDYFQPSVVIHCAVQGGGIGWMKSHPVESGRDNFRINLNVLDASSRVGVKRFVGVSSACVYPKFCPVPFKEGDIWSGFPEPTNATYALSKRAMMEMGHAYHKQYGLHCSFPILANLYGPGDHTNPTRAHVVADLMIRCTKKPKELVVWGTGTPTREFLYIDDAARGVLSCLDAPSSSVINIGTGVETPIAELARLVLKAHTLDVPLRLDPKKPDGQPRKVLSVALAQSLLGWSAQIPLGEGLRKTALWYQSK